jgi:outer membrane receptor protein involved in Fe transport
MLRRIARCAAAFVLPAVAPLSEPAAQQQSTGTLPPVEVFATSPLVGSGVDRDTVPASTYVFRSDDLRRTGMPDLLGSLNNQVGGVALSNASGNPFQPTLYYHGFAGSPLQGTPQGLAVYVNGMRFNQPFGDTVDWDLLPGNAIDQLNMEGSNPVYGLNALGGSVNVQMKNGFTYQGKDLGLSGGSFGQRQGEFEYGQKSGSFATYVAGSVLHQDGWRDFQSTDIQKIFGDVGWRNSNAEFHFSVTGAHSELNGPGTAPVELLAVAPSAQFTAPNQITNRYAAVNLSGTVDFSDTISLQALVYYRYLRQDVNNGNAPNDTPCDDGSGFLCSDSGVSTTYGGAPIPDFLNGGPYSELDTQTTSTHAYGASGQITNTGTVLGRRNHFVGGLAFDGSRTQFNAVSYVGGITYYTRQFVGPGIVIDEPGQNSPVSVGISNATYGIYLTDTLNVTDRLAVTASGRFNATFVDLSDHNGGDLNGSHSYLHFNPAAGLSYQFAPWLTVYGGYAVANRAPTPAELSCASPANSCSLANFFVGDPDLRQVVSQTFEAGFRGTLKPSAKASFRYSVGLFRSDLTDDIAFVNSTTSGRAFFANIGTTRRQGVDTDLRYQDERWLAYLSYSFIDATYQSSFVEAAGSNPAADANGNLTIVPGNHLPGIPMHQVKAGAYYKVTDKWTVGATAVAASSVYLFGDEANRFPPIPGYVTLGLNTSYQVLPNLQLFAWAENLTNHYYFNYGSFSPTGSVFLAQAPNATATASYSPAAPLGIFAGLRLKF